MCASSTLIPNRTQSSNQYQRSNCPNGNVLSYNDASHVGLPRMKLEFNLLAQFNPDRDMRRP